MNLAARSILSGSSEKLSAGDSGVRSVSDARSAAPSKGSTSRGSGSSMAMALTVKSRRDRSASTASENATWGLRESGWYASARWVVTSKSRPSNRAPMVPNRSPWVHTASAPGDRSALT